MNRALSLCLCAGIFVVLPARGYDEVYVFCGPDSVGVIRNGKQAICIGGASNWKKEKNLRKATREAVPPVSPEQRFAITKKILDRKDLLVYEDCGSRPNERDYGLRENPNDTLGKNIYNRDVTAFNKCADRVMEAKHKKEQDKMDAELDRALGLR